MADNRIVGQPGVTLKWSDASSWSQSRVPNTTDRVVVDGSSSAMLIDQPPGQPAPLCQSIDLTNYTKIMTHQSGVVLSAGSGAPPTGGVALNFPSGSYAVQDASAQIVFASSAGGLQTVNFNGNNAGTVVFNDGGGNTTWQLQNPLNTIGTLVLQSGILDLNGKSCTWVAFSSNNSNQRTLHLRSGSLTITGSGLVWDLGLAPTGLVFFADTSTITFTGATPTIRAGDQTYSTVNIQGHGICQLYGDNTFLNLKRTSPSGFKDTELVLFGETQQTVTGRLELSAASQADMFIVHSSSLGTSRTIDLAPSALTPTLVNVTFQDIAVTINNLPPPPPGVDGTNLGDGQHNAGIHFTSAAPQYWVLGGGSWSDWQGHWASSSGGIPGTGRIPLPQDPVIFDAHSPSPSTNNVVLLDMFRVGGDWDLSAIALAMTLQFGPPERAVYGNIKLSSLLSFTFSGTGTQIFSLRGRLASQTFMSNGASVGIPIYLRCPGGKYTLSDALTAQAFEIDAGTFDDGSGAVSLSLGVRGYGVTSYPRALVMGTGNTWTLPGTGTVWDLSQFTSDLSVTKGTAQIQMTSSGPETFLGGGFAYHNISATSANGGTDIENIDFDSLTVSG